MTSVIEAQGSPGDSPGADLGLRAVRIADVGAADLEAVLAMLGRCSPATLRGRFHGFTNGVAYTTEQLTEPCGGLSVAAWQAAACVAVADLVAADDGPWHLGVLVEDAWQRKGVGRLLVSSLLSRARRRGVTAVRADILGEEALLAAAFTRVGTSVVSLDSGTITVVSDIGRRSPCVRRS